MTRGQSTLFRGQSKNRSTLRAAWKLDDRTRRRGRSGVAKARRALVHDEPEQLELDLAS